ncbi:MAG: hypothetical protein HKN04_09790, partial [Rhodothermaceae bacterium]|nr:hypothetical protein [Rhodothermaceae bacterium]
MNRYFKPLATLGAAGLFAFAVTGCDSGSGVDCALTPNDPSCPNQNATVYQ